jgi:hypothetical protein
MSTDYFICNHFSKRAEKTVESPQESAKSTKAGGFTEFSFATFCGKSALGARPGVRVGLADSESLDSN